MSAPVETWEAITEADLKGLLKGDVVRWEYSAGGADVSVTAEVRGFTRGGWPTSIEGDEYFSHIASVTVAAANLRVCVKRSPQPAPTAPLIYARQIGDEIYPGEGVLMVQMRRVSQYRAVGVGEESLVNHDRHTITRWAEAKAVVA